MLPKESIDNPSVLDEIFSEMKQEYEKRKVPMSLEETRTTVGIMLASDEDIEALYNGLVNCSWQAEAFFNRCGIFKIKHEKKLLVWLASITEDFGIGGMILVGYYVQWWINDFIKEMPPSYNIETLSLSMVCDACFPFGILSKELVHEFWDKQKVRATPDNLIDYPAAVSFLNEKISQI